MDLSMIGLFHLGWIPVSLITDSNKQLEIEEFESYWIKGKNVTKLKFPRKEKVSEYFHFVMLHEDIFDEVKLMELKPLEFSSNGEFEVLDVFINSMRWTITFRRFQKVSAVPDGRNDTKVTLFELLLANRLIHNSADNDEIIEYGPITKMRYERDQDRIVFASDIEQSEFTLPNYKCYRVDSFWGDVVGITNRPTGYKAAFIKTDAAMKMRKKLESLKFKSVKGLKVDSYVCHSRHRKYRELYDIGDYEVMQVVRVEAILLKTDDEGKKAVVSLFILGFDGKNLSDVVSFKLDIEVAIMGKNILVFQNEDVYLKISKGAQ